MRAGHFPAPHRAQPARKTTQLNDDEMQRRRRIAAAAFTTRRGELGLTQQQVADKADVDVKTVQNLESKIKPTWPNPMTRFKLEHAVGWRSGELHRLSSPPRAIVDPGLMDELSQLTPEQKRFAIRFLQEDLGLRADEGSAAEE